MAEAASNLPKDFDAALQLDSDQTKTIPETEMKPQHPVVATVEPPPRQTADELIAEMKKIPLFMTDMDDVDEDNPAIAAIRAIAYEGTRAEVAENFKIQGNELVQMRRWADAREFYTKAIVALKSPQPKNPHANSDEDEEIDEEAEAKKERIANEACHANRALCNLELKNYGSCNRDCASALKLNPRNIKAWYRAASACLALDKIPEALDACQSGLGYDANNAPLQALQLKIEKRQTHLAELEAVRAKRAERERRERATLQHALQARNIISRKTKQAPDMEDAAITLENPVDASSTLILPAMLLYPLHAQSDFIKAFREDESIDQHLEYILPTPWDEEHEYTPETVECYMETISGGLIKAGKNLSLLKVLASGKVEVIDDLVKINVVPKAKAALWIAEFKKRRGTN
ncbi:Hypothetical protein R9X50_00338500 [Acrodontium crateriforme]|uniref:Cns1/TTC4 wheel domain-containing protein n=1 Tax=Acrodontium crateriforme TaxID=150365 RepID=A0AAQ3R9V1_9PEZI|nr:Hypothetical protein R9X50_00338500 [Acrodontium crateriforme]